MSVGSPRFRATGKPGIRVVLVALIGQAPSGLDYCEDFDGYNYDSGDVNQQGCDELGGTWHDEAVFIDTAYSTNGGQQSFFLDSWLDQWSAENGPLGAGYTFYITGTTSPLGDPNALRDSSTARAANINPCASAALSAAGVTAQQQIATAQELIAVGNIAANATPLGFFGGMLGYYEAVHSGGPNDIKNQPGPGYHNNIGVDAGNISFGITCPYGAAFCQFAAGLAQTLGGHPNPQGTLATGFDTPSDNAGIQVGQAMRAAGCHE